ncbi:endonuclease family protein [[Eubacterium] yurii subsp. margaretiae ATCC 43715]|nr:endonuclease family protein [[Eubacterium] yurii subsp. margaretiae ATCC 43715]
MVRCYFTNLENVAISELKNTQKSIKAAVAWINFSIYGGLLKELLERNVKIKILLNDDGINQRYLNDIQYLNSIGANIRLVNFTGIMHHKFCILDKRICMFGSFNWTQNANIRNIEDLNICDEVSFVNNYLLEFKALWDLSKTDIKLLRNPQHCEVCKNPIINVLFMEQEGDNETKVDVMQQCGCSQRIVYTDFCDIGVYNNYLAAVETFDDDIAIAQQSGNEILFYQLAAQQDFVIANYLSLVRTNRMGLPIIHAVGVKSWKWYDKHDGDFVYKIIWKERGTEQYVEDEYPIE